MYNLFLSGNEMWLEHWSFYQKGLLLPFCPIEALGYSHENKDPFIIRYA